MFSLSAIQRISWSWPLVLVFGLSLVAAKEAGSSKPSQYAPVKDLIAQIEAYLQQIGTDLAAEGDYGDEQKARVVKDANTLVVLAQVLANHDEAHARQSSAAALFSASQSLASDYEDFNAAKTAFEKVRTAWQSGNGKAVPWEPSASLTELMKQVPIVNNKLRSGVTGRRFDRTIEPNAGFAATLAAISQASMIDMNYCSGKDEEARWAKICADMRDASATVGAAVRQKDQKGATAALARLAKTCDDCHADFKD